MRPANVSADTIFSLGELRQHGLAADHHNISVAGDAAGGADDVLKLGAIHTPSEWQGAPPA